MGKNIKKKTDQSDAQEQVDYPDQSKKDSQNRKKKSNIKLESTEKETEEDLQSSNIGNFFSYQKALNSLIDYLNQTIDDIIAGFTRSDQLLFTHADKKLILNAILEAGFYTFCKFRLEQFTQNEKPLSEDEFLDLMKNIEGEVDLLGYLLVNTRLVHRTLTFDLYLSLLKGGLFDDILIIHAKIVEEMVKRKKKVNKESIKDIKIESSQNLYI